MPETWDLGRASIDRALPNLSCKIDIPIVAQWCLYMLALSVDVPLALADRHLYFQNPSPGRQSHPRIRF